MSATVCFAVPCHNELIIGRIIDTLFLLYFFGSCHTGKLIVSLLSSVCVFWRYTSRRLSSSATLGSHITALILLFFIDLLIDYLKDLRLCDCPLHNHRHRHRLFFTFLCSWLPLKRETLERWLPKKTCTIFFNFFTFFWTLVSVWTAVSLSLTLSHFSLGFSIFHFPLSSWSIYFDFTLCPHCTQAVIKFAVFA